MPAVAQISVDFANLNNLRSGVAGSIQVNTKAVGPLTLTQYCLRSLEKANENFGLNDANHLTYDGGFLTAGDKINYKHSDLKIRENLDVDKGIYVDAIYSRRKGKSADNYQVERLDFDRGITLSPRQAELTTNFVELKSTSTSKSTKLQVQQNSIINSITLESSNSVNSINLETSNFNITGIVSTENNASTLWAKSMPETVYSALTAKDFNNPILTNNYNVLNIRDLVSHVVGTKPPIYINGSFTLLNDYDNQTIIIDSGSNITVTLPAGLREGLQVSFVRGGTGNVTLTPGVGATVSTSPESNFRRLAFPNSVATCLLSKNNRYFIFGDLLPAA